MKKAYFNLIFLILIIILFLLFIYSGIEITESKTETMEWKGGRFILTDLTKVIGILLILTLPIYVFLKRGIIQLLHNHFKKLSKRLKIRISST
ncbi:hypothetical protein IU405_08875 [Polaribacter sp. BAL334]|uniref:hypothetical protein n=1 Tax=Polaribacter sp. BAL334 TaxID=1708178 RepID=UPI0018D22CCF|nr:hypothetical protein [Polaribacter sp. BAL334]MBG7612359.1 hypothetical protein [Polaribacter sp. BAL334]